MASREGAGAMSTSSLPVASAQVQPTAEPFKDTCTAQQGEEGVGREAGGLAWVRRGFRP